MDGLTELLSLLKPSSYTFGAFRAGGRWSVEVPRHEGIRLYAVDSGESWISMEGMPEAVRVTTGDCVLLPRGTPFRVASHQVVPAQARLDSVRLRDGRTITYNGGGDFSLLGGRLMFTAGHARSVLQALPPIVQIRCQANRDAIRSFVSRIIQELQDPQPGSELVADHLAHVILIEAIRGELARAREERLGAWFALADRQITAAVSAVHANPAHRWTLRELASRSGMSRSSFALRFKQVVGAPPMEYVTRWRMRMAAERLLRSRDSVLELALSLGYESESAFGAAFRKIMGCSPRSYRSEARGLASYWTPDRVSRAG